MVERTAVFGASWACPGDIAQTARDTVSINGLALSHQNIRSDSGLGIYAETKGEATYEIALPEHETVPETPDVSVTVPKDHFFVLGDNRYQAKDSRYLGCILFAAIIEKNGEWSEGGWTTFRQGAKTEKKS
jgi:signal peptidase I